ncbi:MAG: hypothetical protein WHS82_07925, partial [Candidatus Methanosuratincola sp.]
MTSRVVVFGAVLLCWMLISTAIGEGSLGLFSKLLESATGERNGILMAAVERLGSTGRFEVDFNGIMGVVEDG